MAFPQWLRYTPALEWARESHYSVEIICEIQRQVPVYSISWRPDRLVDYRGTPGASTVESTVERLLRWDYRHPDEIFLHGFRPQVEELPRPGHPAYNIPHYVLMNVPSIFVGTTRMRRVPGRPGEDADGGGGRNVRWTPRNLAGRFEYGIFAHGGIDVNQTLGPNHPHANQHEIAFPGGIRLELIRTAREYDALGHVVAIWANPNFNFHVLRDRAVPFGDLPEPVYGPNVPDRIWMGPSAGRYVRGLGPASVDLHADLMKEPGDPQWDIYLHGTGNWRVPHGCLALPGNQTWLFSASRVALIAGLGAPSRDSLVVTTGSPDATGTNWKLPWVSAAFFALPDLSYRVAYLFFEDWVAEVDVETHLLLSSGFITDKWPMLRQLGFTRLDAALPVTGGLVMVFSGDSCGVISRDPNVKHAVGPMKTWEWWPGLKEMGFAAVSAALWTEGNVMFFSGSEYGILEFQGHLVFGPRSVQDFKSLASILWIHHPVVPVYPPGSTRTCSI